jgi:hypothetical protein
MCTHWTTDRHLLYSLPFEPLKQRGVQFYIRPFSHFFILQGQHHYHCPLQIPLLLCCFYLHNMACTKRQLSLAYSVSDCPCEITPQRIRTRNLLLSSSVGTTTLVGFQPPAGRFYRVPLPAARQTPNLEEHQ